MPETELVGRERELAAVDAALDRLKAGRGALFLVSGEPGIGKTRLCDEVAARAERTGARVAWGAAWDGGGAPACWPWIQVVRAVRPLVAEPDDGLRQALGPLWDGRAGGGDGDPELSRFRRFDALRSLLQAAAAGGPLVVVLDDLHAADRSTLEALSFVARALRTMPVLIVGAHRDAQVLLDDDLAGLFARIARDGTVLPLELLDKEQIARLLPGVATPDLVDEISRVSGGNPLFLIELRRLVKNGALPGGVPAGVRAIVDERIARLDPAALRLLEAAAVLGREVGWRELSGLSGVPIDAVRAAVRAPALAGLLEDRGGSGGRFSHALFREALLADLSPDRRKELHTRAGEVLAPSAARDPGLEEAVAHHFLDALPSGDAARAVDWAVRAGQTAAKGLAFDRAASLFEGALAALDHLPGDDRRRIDVTLALAGALLRTGRSRRGLALALDAASQARALGDGARLARAALCYGTELRPAAAPDPVLLGLLEEALGALGDSDPRLRARTLARLAAAEQPAPDPAVPVAKAREAIRLARSAADPETLLSTLYTAGSAMVDYAPPEERLGIARELCALALSQGELIMAQQAYARSAIDCFELGDIGGAELAIEGHQRVGKALGHPRWQWRGALLRSMRALIDGRWEDSDRAVAEAAALGAEAEDASASASIALHRLAALRARGSASVAEHEPLLASAAAVIGWFEPMVGAIIRAALYARGGDLTAARRMLAAAPLDEPLFLADAMTLALATDAVVAVGDRARAARLLEAIEKLGERTLTWGVFAAIWEGPASYALGRLFGVLGRPEEAAAALSRALADAEEAGAAPLAARIRAAIGKPAPAAPAPVPEPAAPIFSIAREGDFWTVTSGRKEAHLKHSRGVEIFAELVKNPGREFHVLDLGGAEGGVDRGDAGAVLDAASKQAYQRRIAELTDELEEADAWADAGRRERLRAELEFLEDELGRGFGLGGRERRSGSAVERARVNVQKRLRGVVKKIGATIPELGRHLEAELRTGVYVSYRRVTM